MRDRETETDKHRGWIRSARAPKRRKEEIERREKEEQTFVVLLVLFRIQASPRVERIASDPTPIPSVGFLFCFVLFVVCLLLLLFVVVEVNVGRHGHALSTMKREEDQHRIREEVEALGSIYGADGFRKGSRGYDWEVGKSATLERFQDVLPKTRVLLVACGWEHVLTLLVSTTYIETHRCDQGDGFG